MRLGASTRSYVFKDKPLEKDKSEQIELPEEEEELDNLTEYNTARNKKLVQMVITFKNICMVLHNYFSQWKNNQKRNRKNENL